MALRSDTFTLNVTVESASGEDASISISGTTPYTSDDGSYDMSFSYTLGDPKAHSAFQIDWQSSAGGTPTATFQPSAPQHVRAIRYRGQTYAEVEVGPNEVQSARVYGDVPDTGGTFTGTITMWQPS